MSARHAGTDAGGHPELGEPRRERHGGSEGEDRSGCAWTVVSSHGRSFRFDSLARRGIEAVTRYVALGNDSRYALGASRWDMPTTCGTTC